MSGGQSELADPPKDGISAMIFAPEHNLLLVSSWNTEVRMYDVLMNAKRASYTHKVMRRLSVSRTPHVMYAVAACGLRWCVWKRQDLKAGGAVGRLRCWTAAGEWTRIGASRGGSTGWSRRTILQRRPTRCQPSRHLFCRTCMIWPLASPETCLHTILPLDWSQPSQQVPHRSSLAGAGAAQVVGEHDKAVKAVCWQKELGCVVSGGWDKQVKVWDTRTAQCQSTTEVPDKVPPFLSAAACFAGCRGVAHTPGILSLSHCSRS